jgi:hypothetical protein
MWGGEKKKKKQLLCPGMYIATITGDSHRHAHTINVIKTLFT